MTGAFYKDTFHTLLELKDVIENFFRNISVIELSHGFAKKVRH
jgi:hypothetical protein